MNLSNKTLFASLTTQVERTFIRMDQILRQKQALSLSEEEAELIRCRLHLLRALVASRAIIKRGDRERLQLLVQETEALPKDETANWKLIPLSFAAWLTVMLKDEGSSLIDRLLEEKHRMSIAGDPLTTIRLRVGVVTVCWTVSSECGSTWKLNRRFSNWRCNGKAQLLHASLLAIQARDVYNGIH